jgi:hypothetical protein
MRTRLTVVAVLIAVFVLGISVQAQWPTSVLIEALSSSDRKARELAAMMLGERGTPAEAVEPLNQARTDVDENVRAAAMESLRLINSAPKPAVPDGAGGAIVVFETELTSGKYKGDIDISAQRVAADGRLLWGPSNKPASVADPVGMDRNPVAIPDGAGGAIIAWEHEPTEGEDAGDTDVFARRMDAKGRGMWLGGKNSVALFASKLLERAPAIVPDGKGGAIVVCEAESRTGKDAGDIDLLAQRISADGTKLWNEGKGSQRIASSQWRERWPVAVPDGEGGAFVVYTAFGVGQDAGDIDIEIKRLDGSGKLLWNAGKVPVDVAATKDLEQNPRVVVVGKR